MENKVRDDQNHLSSYKQSSNEGKTELQDPFAICWKVITEKMDIKKSLWGRNYLFLNLMSFCSLIIFAHENLNLEWACLNEFGSRFILLGD